jgi:hypothetical protein
MNFPPGVGIVPEAVTFSPTGPLVEDRLTAAPPLAEAAVRIEESASRDTSTNRYAFLMGNTKIEEFGEHKRAIRGS